MISNLIWCIAGIIGGAIFSFLISYFFYLRSLNRKYLTYDIKTFCIMSDKINQISGLEVKYNSNEIKDLYSSSITIKNIGNSIIKEQDVTPLCPISISTSGIFLNNKNEYIESNPIDKIPNYNLSFNNINGVKNIVKFNFDYIPKNAIITFSLFHTGNITFHGDLMEGKIIKPTEFKKKQNMNHILRIIFIYVITVLLSFLLHFFIILVY